MDCPIHNVPTTPKSMRIDGTPIKRKRDGAVVYFCPEKGCTYTTYRPEDRNPFEFVVTTMIDSH